MTRPRQFISTSAAVLVVAGGLIACGTSSQGVVVVRVGDSQTTKATVAHWMSVMAPEHIVPDPPRYTTCVAHLRRQAPQAIAAVQKEECRQQHQVLKQRALAFLIPSQWLIDEATERGLKTPGAKLATKVQSASVRIRQALMNSEPKVTQVQVAAYYRQNTQRFERPERRYIDIVEKLPTKAAASAALRGVVRRADMSKVAIHEFFDKMKEAETVPWKRAILRAIFAAQPHMLIGPLPLNGAWCFFEVTRVIPGTVKPLAQVQDTIQQQLTGEQRRRTLTKFVDEWRKKWIARTNCSPGYVVQKCRQYRGPKTPEDPLAFN